MKVCFFRIHHIVSLGVIALSLVMTVSAKEAAEPPGEITPLMTKRAAAFRAAQKGPQRQALYLYKRTLRKFDGHHKALVERCALLGFSDVFVSVHNKKLQQDQRYQAKLRQLIAAFGEAKIRVHALTLHDPSVFYEKGKAYADTKAVVDFNANAAEGQRFVGVAADVEPHIMKKKRRDIPADYPWHWNRETGYGKGGANDQLMNETFAILKQARAELPGLEFNNAIGHFFHHYAKAGDLSQGTVGDFLAVCDRVVIMAYSEDPAKVMRISEDELAAAKPEESVFVAVKTYVGKANKTLSFTSWDGMVSGVTDVVRMASVYPAFAGMAFFEFEGLAHLWEHGTNDAD